METVQFIKKKTPLPKMIEKYDLIDKLIGELDDLYEDLITKENNDSEVNLIKKKIEIREEIVRKCLSSPQ
jgi:hypothetical protein